MVSPESVDDKLVLRPSKSKWLGVLLGCAAFVAIGGWMVASHMTVRDVMFGWFGIVFFGAGAAVSIYMLIVGPSLRLDRDGFTIDTLFRKKRYAWREVSEPFWVWVFRTRYNTQRMVVFTTIRNEGWLSAKFTGGANGYLPDTYGMSAQDLARLMNDWRTGTGKAS